MTYTEKIIDLETGEEILRPYTEEEIAFTKKEEAKKAADLEARAAVIAAKDAARKAVLDKLGLTPDEVEALLG